MDDLSSARQSGVAGFTPIERAARALCRQDGHDPDRIGLADDSDHYWTFYVEKARAVLHAIREPSIAMDMACDTERGCVGAHAAIFKKMIDAALDEGA